jgi:hypothetical protein
MSFPEAGKKGDWFVGTMFECCEGGQLNRLLHKDNIKFTIAQKLKLMTDLSQGENFVQERIEPTGKIDGIRSCHLLEGHPY